MIRNNVGMKLGTRMKFKEVIDPGDEGLIFVVLEDRDDRVLVVEESDLMSDLLIKPQHVYSKDELVEIVNVGKT